MCGTCKIRYEKNPLRMLDCKEEKCAKILKDAPVITDFLCEECSKDFENIKRALDNLDIPYRVDTGIVRGLDYYNKTVYEYVSKDLDLAVGGGGRYDSLVSIIGGANTPAVGFGMGIDRLIILLKEYGLDKSIKNKVDVYFLTDDNTYFSIAKYVDKLRSIGYVVETNISNKSFNAQFKYANKIEASFVIILGENELKNNECVFKNMSTGDQENIKLDIDVIKEKIENA